MTMEDRFWAKVDSTGICWEWTGARQKTGYGNFYLGGGKSAPRYGRAHRVAYELLVGPVPDGLVLDHLCRNRACVNPDHLEPVTNGENQRRGSGFVGRNLARTHCPQGHPYSGENLYIRPDRPGRGCKKCKLEAMRRSKARKKGSNV